MTAAQRKTPTVANGGTRNGIDYMTAVDVEVAALWATALTLIPTANVSGTGDAIVATSDTGLVAAPTSYPLGYLYVPVSANTTSATINIDSIGAVSLRDKFGNNLQGGELAVGGMYPIIWDAVQFRAITVTAGSASQVSTAPDVIVQDQKTSGTAGGTFTSGSYQTRTLNTLVRNANTLASLSSNQVTLPAGSYYAEWIAPGVAVGLHKTRLYNVTDGSVIQLGRHSDVGGGLDDSNDSTGSAYFTITSSKAIRLEHRCSNTQATTGLGKAASFGDTEVYAELKFWKQ